MRKQYQALMPRTDQCRKGTLEICHLFSIRLTEEAYNRCEIRDASAICGRGSRTSLRWHDSLQQRGVTVFIALVSLTGSPIGHQLIAWRMSTVDMLDHSLQLLQLLAAFKTPVILEVAD
jgi:hypothetical protein